MACDRAAARTGPVATAVRDELQIVFEHRRVQAEHAARHRVLGIPVFQLDRLLEDAGEFLAKLRGPQMRVLQLDLVHEVDAEIAVHRLVAQDVHVLLGRAGHLVLPAERQDLGEADVEEQPLHQAGEHDQALQQLLVGLRRARLERGVGQGVDERY